MLSHAAAAILRFRSGSAARVLHLHIWCRVAREGLEPGRAAEAEAVGLERPPGCGRGGVAASSTPPGRARQSLLRELIAPAFAIRAGPSVGSGAAALQTRVLPLLEGDCPVVAAAAAGSSPRAASSRVQGSLWAARTAEDRGHRDGGAGCGGLARRCCPQVGPAASRGDTAAVEGGAGPASGFLPLRPRGPASSCVAMATVTQTTRDPRAQATSTVDRLPWCQPGAAGTGFSDGALPF